MKCPASLCDTRGLEAGFSTSDILLAQLFIRAIHFTVQGKETRQHQEKSNKDDVLPHKVQQVKDGRIP